MANSCEQQAVSENLRPLSEWLEKRRAFAMWSVDIENVGTLTAFAVNNRIIHVLKYCCNDQDGKWKIYGGWEIFIPACADNSIDATLEAAHRACGLGRDGQDGR